MESGLKMTTKLFLVFVAICATATATAIPTTNANGTSLSAFLTDLKEGLENLLGLVQRFEMEQSTQIDQTTSESTMANDQSIPRMLVVTGYGNGRYAKKTELWPKPESQCALPDVPLEVDGAVGFWTAQGPMVCGGNRGGNKCFLYKNHQWMPSNTMQTARQFASQIQINPNQALIIGGTDGNDNDLKTTELISFSGSEEGNKFPVRIGNHCSFPLNATHGIVTGGDQDWYISASTWYVDLTTTRVTPGPTMKTGRRSHGCSVFQHGTKSYGIVSGGRYSDGLLDSTEIIELDQESPTWTEGPKLPRRLKDLTLVKTSQGTYAMGGEDKNDRNEVLQLDCPGDQISSCQWLEMPEKLDFARSGHVSIPLPDSYEICN